MKRPRRSTRTLSLRPLVMLLSLLGLPAQADDSFPQKVERILREHQLIRMVDADVLTAEKQIAVERSAYFPHIGLQSYTGREKLDRDVGTSGRFTPRENSVQINQLLTDFGATGARVDAARSIAEKEGFERRLQVQNLLLAAVEAQLKLIRAQRTYDFARESEANVLKQTQLESARVEAGRGYATDVLQAKAQLAGAEARRVAANLQLAEAINRYKAVFGELPPGDGKLQGLALPEGFLPASEDDLGRSVQDSNPDTLAALARQRVAERERKSQINKELMPRVDLQLSRSRSNELDGIEGSKSDTRMLLRLNWNFDLGLRAHYVAQSADAAVASAVAKTEYVRVQADEEASSAWANWQMSKARAGYLANQVAISSNFLDLARRERELGRRSLLDLLSGEVALINARSDALSARIDEIIAAFRVMRASGKLDVAVFAQPGVLVDASGWSASPAAPAAGIPTAAAPVQPAPAPEVAVVSPPITPSPAPGAVPTAAPAAVGETAALAAVERWRAAWAARDIDAYLASYAPGFKPAKGTSHAAWVAQRKQRIGRAAAIELALDNPRVSREQDAYAVEFEQRYSAGGYADRTRKRLLLREQDGKLLIVQEQLLDAAAKP